jgi:hypothetical protein
VDRALSTCHLLSLFYCVLVPLARGTVCQRAGSFLHRCSSICFLFYHRTALLGGKARTCVGPAVVDRPGCAWAPGFPVSPSGFWVCLLSNLPSVGIHPQIDHMKLGKNTSTENFSQGCVSHPIIFLFLFSAFLNSTYDTSW